MVFETLAIASGPFLITFRESLEAALIVVIVAAYLNKIGKAALKRYLYMGTAAAIILSVFIGILLYVFYGGLTGVAEKLFEGSAAITATAVLTYMIFWMAKNSHQIKDELHGKIDITITKGNMIGIAVIAFIAVFREGIETVLFLTAVAVQQPLATVIGTVTGFGAVFFLAIFMFKEIYGLNLKSIFKYSSVLLLIFAAGLFGFGVHEYIEAAESYKIDIGFFASSAYDINPPAHADGSYPLLHEKGAIGSVFKALVGYDGNPEWLRVFVYLGYWLVIGLYLIKTYNPQTAPRTRIKNIKRTQ
ncbi:MAG: FTR1 family protein [Candidatus Aenigmarchaeota archaeon]|nr:FTR1 family protein [Candidatus Aenigmarchaeota archaeon]